MNQPAMPVHVKITTEQVVDYSTVFVPTQAEAVGMIDWLIRKSGLSTTAIAAITGVTWDTLRQVRFGKKLNKTALRCLWFLQMSDMAPELLHDVFTIATWGKALKIGERQSRYVRPQFGKRADGFLLDPTRVWMNVDWRICNGTICRRYKYSPWQVKNMRLRLAKIPKEELRAHVIKTRRNPDYFAPFLEWEIPVSSSGQPGRPKAQPESPPAPCSPEPSSSGEVPAPSPQSI